MRYGTSHMATVLATAGRACTTQSEPGIGAILRQQNRTCTFGPEILHRGVYGCTTPHPFFIFIPRKNKNTAQNGRTHNPSK